MWCLETLHKINASGGGLAQHHPLRYHPEIVKLRRFVAGLPVRADYKLQLRRTIYRYADHFISGTFLRPCVRWDNEDQLQQLALGDWNEECLLRMFQKGYK